MLVRMGVGLARRILRTVRVAVMLVVAVRMGVRHAAMGMGVRVPLGDVETPTAISVPAATSWSVSGCCNAITAVAAPMNGAVEK